MLSDGAGDRSQGFKAEWTTLKDNKIWVGITQSAFREPTSELTGYSMHACSGSGDVGNLVSFVYIIHRSGVMGMRSGCQASLQLWGRV